MKKNTIFAALLGAASGVVAAFCAKELLRIREKATENRVEERPLPAPQIVVELPQEKEQNEIIPQDGIENEPVLAEEEPAQEPETAPAAEEKSTCYYLPQGEVWHNDCRCIYLAGKKDIMLSGDVEAALAAGKKRACGRCGA